MVPDSLRLMDCSPLDSSVHEIFQARVLEWAAISFSRGSSQRPLNPSSPGQMEVTLARWVTVPRKRLRERRHLAHLHLAIWPMTTSTSLAFRKFLLRSKPGFATAMAPSFSNGRASSPGAGWLAFCSNNPPHTWRQGLSCFSLPFLSMK